MICAIIATSTNQPTTGGSISTTTTPFFCLPIPKTAHRSGFHHSSTFRIRHLPSARARWHAPQRYPLTVEAIIIAGALLLGAAVVSADFVCIADYARLGANRLHPLALKIGSPRASVAPGRIFTPNQTMAAAYHRSLHFPRNHTES